MRLIQITYSLLILLGIMVVMYSCKSDTQDDSSTEETTQQGSYKLTAKDVQSIEYIEYVLSDASEQATRDWVKFQELNLQMALLKKADLSFFKDDKAILLGFLTDLKNEIPENLNLSSIYVRIIALETVIYKLEGTANLHDVTKEDLLNSIKAVLVAHTNLIFQINKTLEKAAQKIQKPN